MAQEIAAQIGANATIVEFGSGASRKIRTLLDALTNPARYVAIDISQEYLEASLARLQPDYPSVEMFAVPGDYTGPVRLPIELAGHTTLGFFPGRASATFRRTRPGDFLPGRETSWGRAAFLSVPIRPTTRSG